MFGSTDLFWYGSKDPYAGMVVWAKGPYNDKGQKTPGDSSLFSFLLRYLRPLSATECEPISELLPLLSSLGLRTSVGMGQ